MNISIVHGSLSEAAINVMRADQASLSKAAAVSEVKFQVLGLSTIMHPRNHMAPTVHVNFRYFETSWPDGSAAWFGGGTDLSPAYLFDEDAIHFHKTLQGACDQYNSGLYPKFKAWCDKYFTNKHRGEGRGIGGIFFDDLDCISNNVLRLSDQLPTASYQPTYLSFADGKTRRSVPIKRSGNKFEGGGMSSSILFTTVERLLVLTFQAPGWRVS